MGKKNRFIVNSWKKYDGAICSVVSDVDFEAYVDKKYWKDIDDDGENYFLQECELVIKQNIDVDDSTYATFILRQSYSFLVEVNTEVDSKDNWRITNGNYSKQNDYDKEQYELSSLQETTIRQKINNNKRFESNTWELQQDNINKKYKTWQPFNIIYNCVLEDSRDIPGAKNIYAGIVFNNEQYEIRLYISQIACLGRNNYSDEELKVPELRDLPFDENFYMGDVFTTFTNKKTSTSTKLYKEEAKLIKDFILIKQKS